MSEPVMCPHCGESFAARPADGKCTKCGGAIPAAGAKAPTGIDEELARLAGKQGASAKSAAAVQTTHVQAERPAKKRLPAWVKLTAVLVFALVAGIATMSYMKRWRHDQLVESVRNELQSAKLAAAEDRVRDAVQSLESARERVSKWFDASDPDRGVLLSEVETAQDSLREELKKKLQEMIKQDKIADAQRFFETEIKSIDHDGSLREVVDNALKDRTVLREFRKTLRDAQKFHEEGNFAQALAAISDLRRRVGDPIRARGEAMAELRTTVEKLQKQWVEEAYSKGMAQVQQGKLDEAEEWLKLGKKYVWSGDVGLRRKLQETLYHVAEKRVVGVVVNINQVRVVQADAVRSELVRRLQRKLRDEGFVILALSAVGDPKGAQLARAVMVDYKEEPSREFVSQNGLEKAMGTRITCNMKVVATKGGKVLWEDSSAGAQTSLKGGGLGEGGFNDATLRLQAFNTFTRAFDGVRIPSTYLVQ